MAGGAVLTLPPPIPVQRSHGFTRPTTRRGAECAPPTVKPLYLQTYFRLAASGLRGKAAADNQSLRLHRPQATVSPTAVSYSFLIGSLRPNRTTDRRAERLRKPAISPMKRWRDRHRGTRCSGDPVSACLPPTPLHRCIGLRVRSLNDPHDARLRPFNRHTLEPAAASRCEPTHPSPSAC